MDVSRAESRTNVGVLIPQVSGDSDPAVSEEWPDDLSSETPQEFPDKVNIDLKVGPKETFITMSLASTSSSLLGDRGTLRFNGYKQASAESLDACEAYSSLLRHNLEKNFILGKKLGSGSFGVVYEAKCKKTGRTFAVKSVTPKEDTENNDDDGDMEAEIRHLCELDHPYIIKLHNYFREGDAYHLVMDLCRGGTLGKFVRRSVEACRQFLPNFNSGLDNFLSGRFLWQMISGVAFLHHHGYIHRDIKPENYLVVGQDATSSLKLADFGLAHRMPKGHMLTRRVGTVRYAAPELVSGLYTHSADLWSVGMTAFYVCTGHSSPFPKESDTAFYLAAKAQNFVDVGDAWNPHNKKTKQLVLAMLDANPATRPSAKQLIQEYSWLRNHADGAGCCVIG